MNKTMSLIKRGPRKGLLDVAQCVLSLGVMEFTPRSKAPQRRRERNTSTPPGERGTTDLYELRTYTNSYGLATHHRRAGEKEKKVTTEPTVPYLATGGKDFTQSPQRTQSTSTPTEKEQRDHGAPQHTLPKKGTHAKTAENAKRSLTSPKRAKC